MDTEETTRHITTSRAHYIKLCGIVIGLILIMSIDVFGRVLDSKAGGSRGPPGEGFKRTSGGHFDIENKRLCNVAIPEEESDAVNLGTLRQALQTKPPMGHELQEVKGMVESLHGTFENTLNQWKADLDGVQALIQRNAAFIAHLDSQVK